MIQERARIARELHDTVSQTLYAISLGASRARSLLQRNERAELQRIIDDILQLANAGQSELRALLTDIRSDRLTSGGLTAGLEDLAADVRTRTSLSVGLSLPDEPAVPAATKEALLLIVREALHNVVRHSAASRVDIALEIDRGQLVLLITDDGRGFDTATLRPGHFGLQSMRERATAVGGTLALVSAVGLGTHLRVSVPGEAQRSADRARARGHSWTSWTGLLVPADRPAVARALSSLHEVSLARDEFEEKHDDRTNSGDR